MPRISQKFIDRKVRLPDHGQVIYRDDELIGFGLRVTRGGATLCPQEIGKPRFTAGRNQQLHRREC